jgi:hypothetical protein
LQRGECRLRFGREAFGDEADQLARLHDGALHVPQLTGDVLGGADRELLLEGRSRLLVGSRSAHLHNGVVGAASSREPPHPRRSVEAVAAVCIGERDPTGDRGRDQPTSEGRQPTTASGQTVAASRRRGCIEVPQNDERAGPDPGPALARSVRG